MSTDFKGKRKIIEETEIVQGTKKVKNLAIREAN